MIKCTFTMKEMVESTTKERVKKLKDKGIDVAYRENNVRVESGDLETVIADDKKTVTFIWYAPGEDMP